MKVVKWKKLRQAHGIVRGGTNSIAGAFEVRRSRMRIGDDIFNFEVQRKYEITTSLCSCCSGN